MNVWRPSSRAGGRGTGTSRELIDQHQVAARAVDGREENRALVGREGHAVPPLLPDVEQRRPLSGRELVEVERGLVRRIADGEKVEAAVGHDEVDRVAQPVDDLRFFAASDRYAPDRRR